jgi:8-oxo-dGTP pyrophosphatase MutT (NUDIX family)
MSARTFTHPDVFTLGIEQGWADRETDPTRIDWSTRVRCAEIPFEVIDGRPVNPCASTGVRYGRNELGHWGEALAADALVVVDDFHGDRWLLMIERGDGHGWAAPGGFLDPGEHPSTAALRELEEETGLRIDFPVAIHRSLPARYVPDPRASDEAWVVTVPTLIHLGQRHEDHLPPVVGTDDAHRAAWIRADSHTVLLAHLQDVHGGRLFPAHQAMLTDLHVHLPANSERETIRPLGSQ